MIGIYKITSPSGKVYIGQSIDIEERKRKYASLRCKEQPRVYRSLLKYGFKAHTFEFIIECEESQLNNLERYYQELYQSVGKNGLNCMLTSDDNVAGRHSEETKNKIRITSTGRKHSQETIELLRKISKNREGNIEHLNNIRKLRKDYSQKLETRDKISSKLKGRKQSDEHRNKITASKIGKKRDPIKNAIRVKKLMKPIINIKTGEIYTSVKEASEKIGVKANTLYGALNAEKHGYYKNKYNIQYA